MAAVEKKARLRTERLEARVSSELKRLFQRAADLEGVTLSDFVIGSVRQAALKTLHQDSIIRLSERDARAFAQAILRPPQPGTRLRAAAKRYKKLVRAV